MTISARFSGHSMAYSLSLYIEDTRSLLRDGLGLWTPTSQLTRWINQSRRQAARRTSCCRLLLNGQSQFGASAMPGFFVPGAAVPGNLPSADPGSGSTNAFQTIPGVEAYSFDGFANPFLRAQYAGADRIIDIFNCSIAWGSASYRPTLNWCPWVEMQAYMRAWAVLNSAFPLWWSTMGDADSQVVYLWPPPVEAMEMEWEVFCVPKPLYTDDDVELLPENFSQAIKFGAAALAYINTRPAQAQIMYSNYLDTLGVGRSSADYGHISSMYTDTGE